MIDYIQILQANPNGVLATQNGGRIATRVFQFLFAEEGRVYFCTSNEKSVFAQLQANPAVSFCTYPADFAPVLSVNGRAVFVEDAALKARALAENPGIRGIYQTPDNPVFALFYIAVETLDTFSFAEGPKTYAMP